MSKDIIEKQLDESSKNLNTIKEAIRNTENQLQNLVAKRYALMGSIETIKVILINITKAEEDAKRAATEKPKQDK